MVLDRRDIIIAGFGGSLRTGSYSKMVLNQLGDFIPEKSKFIVADISEIDLFNMDNVGKQNLSLDKFKETIANADCFVIVTPEYNYSVPGYLKNVLDAASIPISKNPFAKKTGGIISTSTGMLGGARAQYHLRQIFTYLDSRIINKPEIFINFVDKKFDSNGKLVDENTIKFLKQFFEFPTTDVRNSSV